ncbi:MAG: transcriptional regulator, partial [Thermoplasmata archaeon]
MEIGRETLIGFVRAVLKRNGYNISSDEFRSPAYDMIASNDENIFIIKVLYNVDTLKNDVANEIRLIAKLI